MMDDQRFTQSTLILIRAILDKYEELAAGEPLQSEKDMVMTSDEVMSYLKISRPTLLGYIRSGKIKAVKAGRGWRILKSELDRFFREK